MDHTWQNTILDDVRFLHCIYFSCITVWQHKLFNACAMVQKKLLNSFIHAQSQRYMYYFGNCDSHTQGKAWQLT